MGMLSASPIIILGFVGMFSSLAISKEASEDEPAGEPPGESAGIACDPILTACAASGGHTVSGIVACGSSGILAAPTIPVDSGRLSRVCGIITDGSMEITCHPPDVPGGSAGASIPSGVDSCGAGGISIVSPNASWYSGATSI
jgi:hypothetical protein